MKKALKIVIPIVLVLALLTGAVWFFLFYNRAVTTNFLVNEAARMTRSERYERAITYYGWAAWLMPDRTDIPLALADTYVASGNFTKAEYTLVRAISSNPGDLNLYQALSQTYVTQDKLLDAVQMLDRITDENVKMQLDSLRPAAPMVSPVSGYYSEYIQLDVTSQEPKVYLTTDGDYPANDQDLYTDPITLSSGETTVIALAVNDLGFVSPATTCGYTVGGVVEAVTLADPAVDAAVRELLTRPAGSVIMSDELWDVTALELPETVADLSDLVYFSGLRSLTIRNVSGLDFSILSQLTDLQELDLSGCTLSSNALDAISTLTALRSLKLDSCALTDISKLAQLTQLTTLHLSNNSITDVGVLSLMLQLETVTLANNPITSIAGLSACSNLISVDLTGCGITSIGSLSDKAFLETIQAANNQIIDLAPLEGCCNLMTLVVSANRVEDISVLAMLTNLMTFEGDNNFIKAIPDFDEDVCNLVRFSAAYNEIPDLAGLAGINTLNYVNLDYNQIADIAPLADSINLIQLDVWDNPIPKVKEAVEPFEESSIIVNFNPNFEVPEEEPEEEAE